MDKIYPRIKNNLSVITVFFLIILIIFLFMFNRIVYFIKSGEQGVLYRTFFGGTVVTRVYSEGIQFIWPWNKMFIYNVRVQEVPHEFYVLTKNGMKVDLSISIRYYPELKLVGLLHQKVGPDYVNIVVIPEIEHVLRVLIGRLQAEEVYTTKQAIIEKAISQAIEQITRRYVNVDAVIIKTMKLPPAVETEIQAKIKQKHRADAYKFRLEREIQEKERKRIEAEGLKILHKALTPEILRWKGIEATLKLSESENSKIVIFGGGGEGGLPIIGNIPLSHYPVEFPESPKGTKSARPSGKTETSKSPMKTEPSVSQSEKSSETPGETEKPRIENNRR